MAGGNGTMKSTCAPCGGKGYYGVNKPSDWDVTHPDDEEPPVKSPEIIALETPPPAGSVVPPPRSGHVHNTPLGDPLSSVFA